MLPRAPSLRALIFVAVCALMARTATAAPVSSASACFHQSQGLQLRFDLDFAEESTEATYDLYVAALYGGQWFFRNAAGAWLAHQPSAAPVAAQRAVAHPRTAAHQAGNTVAMVLAEPLVRSAQGLGGLQVLAGFGKSGPGSFDDLIARQRFGLVATVAGTEPVVSSCATAPASTGFAIQAATWSGNTISVTGSGFGSKAQAAPLKVEDFESRALGALPASFGYRNYGGFGGTTAVDDSTAFSGGKSLLHQGNFGPVSGNDVAESFPHIAVTGFSSQELFLSYRLKFKSNGGRIVQLKFNRSGMEVNGDCYGGKPKFYSSYYPVGPSANRYDSDKTLAGGVQGGILQSDGARDEGWAGEASMGSGSVVPLQEDVWYQVEEHYRLNDIGQANGSHRTWVNGNLQINRNALLGRSDASQLLNCSYLVIGMDYWINPTSTKGVSVWYDDHYLDTTPARLVLANAPTWAAATIRNPQPATQWTDSGISAQWARAGFAAGSDAWLYVVRADATVSAGWKIVLP